MINNLEEESVLLIDVLLPEKDTGDGDISRDVTVWFVGDSSCPILSLSGSVKSWCSHDAVLGEDGQRLVKAQVEVSLEEMMSLWNSIGDFQSGELSQAVGAPTQPHFVVGELAGSDKDPGGKG